MLKKIIMIMLVFGLGVLIGNNINQETNELKHRLEVIEESNKIQCERIVNPQLSIISNFRSFGNSINYQLKQNISNNKYIYCNIMLIAGEVNTNEILSDIDCKTSYNKDYTNKED